MAPPNNRSFSVNVVLPASGCEMIAKVRRRSTSVTKGDRAGAPSGARMGMFMAGWMWHFKPSRSSLEGRTSLETSLPAISHYLFLKPRIRQLSVTKDHSLALGKTMASDNKIAKADKPAKADPAPKSEAAAKDKSTSGEATSKTESGEAVT